MGKVQRVIDFFGLKRSIVGLLGMVILVGMGEKMADQFLPIYLLALGAAETMPGILGGITNLLSALYSLPGGYLAERFGTKKSLLIFNLIAMFGFIIVIVIPHWAAVLVGAVFFLSWTAISLPATMGLVSKVLPKDKRTMGVTVHSLVRRIPMAVGPIMGGVLIDIYGTVVGVRLAFAGALVLAISAAVLQQILIQEDRKEDKKPTKDLNPLGLLKYMSPELKKLLIADILIRFCEQIPAAYVVVWAMQTIANPVDGAQFGILRTVEMVTAMLIYIPVAYLADKGNKKPFVVMTFVFFTAFPAVLYFSKSFWMLVIAFVVRGLKEFGEPTRKALIMDLAPEDRKAGMFGLYYLMRDVLVSVSAFASGWLWLASPKVNFVTAFVFGAIGTIWFAMAGKDTSKPVYVEAADKPAA
jgi:MFS family permease